MMASEARPTMAALCSPPGKRGACDLAAPIVKRPKLSPEEKLKEKAAKEAERLAKEAERAARDAEKEAEKAAKEAEKAIRDAEREAERLAREAEKEARRLEREEKKRQKDDARAREKQLKDETKAKEQAALEKKERNQLRMGNFFKKADPKPPPTLCKEESSVFKPFYVREFVILASQLLPPAGDGTSFEGTINSEAENVLGLRTEFRSRGSKRTPGDPRRCSWKPLRERLYEVSNIALEERLKDVTYKLLQFHSDVRPAYFGTMTKRASNRGLARGRKPYAKTSELNYDYDSEADWIEGDDEDMGEDLGDDDDISVASKDTYGEDDDDFLDDDEHTRAQDRSRQGGTLLPTISGIFTLDEYGPVAHMKLQKLMNITGPIDPFENYWDPVVETKPLTPTTKVLNGVVSVESKPCLGHRKSSSSTTTAAFPDKYLPDFKKSIQGSNLTKILLVEKLRADFKVHKISKRAIEDKLGEIAHRLGKGQHDVWALRD